MWKRLLVAEVRPLIVCLIYDWLAFLFAGKTVAAIEDHMRTAHMLEKKTDSDQDYRYMRLEADAELERTSKIEGSTVERNLKLLLPRRFLPLLRHTPSLVWR